MSNAQLACTYAALILSESGKVDAASIGAVTKAAGVTVSGGMASAFADAAKHVDFAAVLKNISFGGAAAGGAAAAAAPAAGGAAAAPAAKAAAAKESESDDDVGFGLFD